MTTASRSLAMGKQVSVYRQVERTLRLLPGVPDSVDLFVSAHHAQLDAEQVGGRFQVLQGDAGLGTTGERLDVDRIEGQRLGCRRSATCLTDIAPYPRTRSEARRAPRYCFWRWHTRDTLLKMSTAYWSS